MANLYAHKLWAAFRRKVIELDGSQCVECGRSRDDGVVLQVHHKRYISGRKPWEYETSECETLCQGCHAREHGEIRPDAGWEYVGEEDLGDLTGNCELCDNSIRYVHYVQHEHWEQMGVGTHCCDNLTGTREAAEGRRRLGRYRRFISSAKWTAGNDLLKIRHCGLIVAVVLEQQGCKLIINDVQGRKTFTTVLAAKNFLFEFMESGEAAKFAERQKAKANKS